MRKDNEHQLTEEDLSVFSKVQEFSIQKGPNGEDIFIFVCDNKDSSEALLKIIHSNPFDLDISTNKETGNYTLNFTFLNSEYGMRYDTGKNAKNYPPLKLFDEKKIQHLTTGVLDRVDKNGRHILYSLNFFKLISQESIEASFGGAKGIQFVAGRKDKEPGAIVLTYDNWDHIFKFGADGAYNFLMEQLDFETSKLSITEEGETASIKITDENKNLSITIPSLPFSKEQLTQFTESSDPGHSFAFVLGFPAPQGDHAAIASTRRGEDFKMISFRGYELN